uniref:YfgM family protein n=1 Tax=Thaumasiovibrio occultus TaxID=1891184 RepID=UPI000B360EC2|nr:tetratricopeptide repeat protein [Thaumasiovibrio occultus]
MEFYETEEQQVEAVKKWWRENGKAIILGAVVGLGGLFGWRAYQDNLLAARIDASQAYMAAQTQFATSGEVAAVEGFISSYTDSGYASLSALQLAKHFVDAGEFDNAIAQLQWVIDNSGDVSLTNTAVIRLARIEASQGDYAAAEALLAGITQESWKASSLELQGDIKLAQGDQAAARDAYRDALALSPRPEVQLKLNDLAL